jgi:adenylylsulfate kinase-like enzyme
LSFLTKAATTNGVSLYYGRHGECALAPPSRQTLMNQTPMRIVVMGVAGSGKSTLGARLA